MRRFIFILFWISISIVVISQCKTKPTDKNKIVPLTRSWEKAIPNQKNPEGLGSLKAKDCGVCHQEHYQEWQNSTHANAWIDPQFQSEIKKETSPYLCINCHIPLQNQQEYIVSGLIEGDVYQPIKKKNLSFDTELQQEGINCAGCHVRKGAVIGPTGTNLAPHKTVKDNNYLSEKLCISCHNAVAVVTSQLACSFETGDEWKAGPYPKKDTTCISCHMPETYRSIMSGLPKRKSRFHTFAGSGISKFSDKPTQRLNGLEIKPLTNENDIKQDDSLIYKLKLTNKFAGHKVPTGDPERFILIRFLLLNDNDSIINSKKYRIGEIWEWYPEAKKLSDNNMLPKESRIFYFSAVSTGKESKLKVMVTKHRITNDNIIHNNLPEDYPAFITIYKKIIDL